MTMIDIWKYKSYIIISLLSIVIVFLYLKNNALQKEVTRAVMQEKITEGNYRAYRDSVSQIPDSIQIYHVFIKDLKQKLTEFENKNKIKSGKIALLNSKIFILEDSVKILEKKIKLFEENTGTDSVSYRMNIFKENDFAKVSGWARFYLKKNYGSYDIDITTKQKTIESFVTYKLGDSSIISYVEINKGRVLSSSTISPDLYKLIASGINKEEFGDKLKFGFGLNLTTKNFKESQIVPELYSKYDFQYVSLKTSAYYQNEAVFGSIGASVFTSFNKIITVFK